MDAEPITYLAGLTNCKTKLSYAREAPFKQCSNLPRPMDAVSVGDLRVDPLPNGHCMSERGQRALLGARIERTRAASAWRTAKRSQCPMYRMSFVMGFDRDEIAGGCNQACGSMKLGASGGSAERRITTGTRRKCLYIHVTFVIRQWSTADPASSRSRRYHNTHLPRMSKEIDPNMVSGRQPR